MWSIGNDWVNGSGASHHLGNLLRAWTRRTEPQITSATADRAIAQLKERLAAGGMFIVQSEIYLNDQTEFADLVLPAATWGESDFTRNNAERRLRLYGKIMDPPGDARPDWWAVAQVAQRMGYDGFDWPDSNAVFEESGPRASGRKDYSKLVEKSTADGQRAHDVLRALGTTGIQTPVKIEDDQMVGTVRMHEDLVFKGPGGKSNFVFVDLEAVAERNELLGPNSDEFWVLTGRVNGLWQSLYPPAPPSTPDNRSSSGGDAWPGWVRPTMPWSCRSRPEISRNPRRTRPDPGRQESMTRLRDEP